jgi:hypothetical protein
MPSFSSVGGRVSGTFGGLMFTAISLVFIVGGISMVVRSARQAATYRPVTATVTRVTGGDDASDRVAVAYSYSIDALHYGGELNANDNDKTSFNELRQFKAGQTFTVYYDPQNWARSVRSVRADAHGLAFSIFALLFLTLGLNELWLRLTGRELIRSRRINAQSSPTPGGGVFLVFAGLCAAGAIGQWTLASALPWPASLLAGLVIMLAVIPVGTLWAARVARRWRAAKAAELHELHAAQSAAAAEDDGDPPAADECLVAVGGLGKKMAIALGVAVFWSGITGAFLAFAVGSLWKHHYAATHYAATQGVVLTSKLNYSSGDEGGTTVAPKVRYRYAVAGNKYLGDRYDFAEVSSSDGSYARRVVAENPAGKAVTVYYNPDKPADAILSLNAPASGYFLLLFLQPFLLVGLLLIGWCVSLPLAQRRVRRFAGSDAALPWDIPGWGVMQQDFDGLTIRARRNLLAPLGHLMLGYGLACFAAMFVVGFFFHGTGDANPVVIRNAFLAAAGVGIAAMLRKIFLQAIPSRVTIDMTRKRLSVHTRRREHDVPLDEIRQLQLRQVLYPDSVQVNNQRVRYLLLEAVTKSGQSVPLHAFSWQAGREQEITAVVRRVASLLAGKLGCRADYRITEVADRSASFLAGPLGLLSGGSYGDLA